jgi:hypothetical protein
MIPKVSERLKRFLGVMDRQDRKPPRSQLDEPANDNGELILFVEGLHLHALGCSGCLLDRISFSHDPTL